MGWVAVSNPGYLEEDSASSCSPPKLVPPNDPGGMQMVTNLAVRTAGHIDHDVKMAGDDIFYLTKPTLVYIISPAVLISLTITIER